MKTTNSKITRTLFLGILFLFFTGLNAQSPCFCIRNNTNCGAEVTWETVDGTNATITGASFVTLAAFATLNITGAACVGAADIYVRVEKLGGISTGQSQPVNGVITPVYSSEVGSNANTCNLGLWGINWGTGSCVQIN